MEVVLAALAQYGCALKDASSKHKNNKKMVLAAVAQDGGALMFASAELKNDKELVLVVFHAAVAAWVCAGACLGSAQADMEVVLSALAQDGCALKDASSIGAIA